MKDIYFFSCENIAIISSKALNQYPKIEKYVSIYIKPENTVLFFAVKEPFVTKTTFNESTPIGFANVILDHTQVRVSPLMGVDYSVKKIILEYIANFFTIPIVIEVNIDSQDLINEINFLTHLGFGDPVPNPNNNQTVDLRLTQNTDTRNVLNKIMSLTKNTPPMCKLKIFFPKTLANTLISHLSEPNEVGGKICITRYGKDSDGSDIAVLGFNTSELVLGNPDTFTVNIPPDKVAPFSFHTHPDICYTQYGCFLGWPSGPDIAFIVGSYLENRDILAHFIISSEGIWVVHLRPQFQKLLHQLKNTYTTMECQKKLVKFIRKSFEFLEGQRKYEMISPIDRSKARKKFIEVSKNLKISDYKGTDVELMCSPYIQDDALLFDINLIKWGAFESNKVVISFSYIVDEAGGLPCFLPVDCSILAHLFNV